MKAQEVEIGALLTCLDSLRKFVVELNMQLMPSKYHKYDELMEVY